MAKVEGIAQNMLISLNGLCNQSYRWLGIKFKALIEDAMESAGLTEIDFTCGTGLAKDGIRSRYGYITKMTCNDGLIAFYYTHVVARGGHNDSSIVTYDDFMSGNLCEAIGQMEAIIREIIGIVNCLPQMKEIEVNLPNGISINCEVPCAMLKEDCSYLSLLRYLEVQTEDTVKNFANCLKTAIENKNYTFKED